MKSPQGVKLMEDKPRPCPLSPELYEYRRATEFENCRNRRTFVLARQKYNIKYFCKIFYLRDRGCNAKVMTTVLHTEILVHRNRWAALSHTCVDRLQFIWHLVFHQWKLTQALVALHISIHM